jgi:hypothetical protein
LATDRTLRCTQDDSRSRTACFSVVLAPIGARAPFELMALFGLLQAVAHGTLFRYFYCLSREGVGADAVAEVAEGLAVLAVLFEVMQHRHESRHDFVGGH